MREIVVMCEEIKINKNNKSILFINNGIAFSQFGVADEILDLITNLQTQLQQKENIIKEVREKVDNFDVFKEFTFPLMKRDEEQQVKSSIDYEWRKSIKEPILEILDKGE
jgi:hypothetical protein